MKNGSSITADRLVEALRDLLSREALAARAGSGTRVRALQERIKPMVALLARLASEPSGSFLAGDISELVEKMRQNRLLMQQSLMRLRMEIESRSEALGRARRIKPIYRAKPTVAVRLNASS
jgi:hypothetical protein